MSCCLPTLSYPVLHLTSEVFASQLSTQYTLSLQSCLEKTVLHLLLVTFRRKRRRGKACTRVDSCAHVECALRREGNGWSHDYCRRQWSLADADYLRYKYMNAWDAAMQRLDEEYGFLSSGHLMVSHSGDKEQVCMHAIMYPQRLFWWQPSPWLHATTTCKLLMSDPKSSGWP